MTLEIKNTAGLNWLMRSQDVPYKLLHQYVHLHRSIRYRTSHQKHFFLIQKVTFMKIH